MTAFLIIAKVLLTFTIIALILTISADHYKHHESCRPEDADDE